jgi:NAD(P)-dependent dehydrogenase (short-subunit alcohol dehydrogenase family)
MSRSFVVTGGGRGIGRALVERLLGAADTVVALELDRAALEWAEDRPDVLAVIGDAGDEAVAEQAADLAQSAGTLSGWVNNAAVFQDALLDSTPTREILDLIALNFNPVLVGCATAIRRFLDADSGGAIVNVSSHQAQRPVPGSLPYSTAKAAVEGLTRALAVEYGPRGIRVNAVALGSIRTERYDEWLATQRASDAEHIENQMALLHPVGRIGSPEDVAATVAYLLSDGASFINGAIVPVDGGRSVLARDPEEPRSVP